MTGDWRKIGQPTTGLSATNPMGQSPMCFYLVTTDVTVPAVPTGVRATTNSCSQISLSWNPASDNAGGSGLKGYEIFRNGVSLKFVPASTTAMVDGGLSASTSYSYAVCALDWVGNESALSAPSATATPPCPNQPPIANAGPPQSNTVGNLVAFDGSGSRDQDGTLVSYNWNFGDGASDSGTQAFHAYASAGTYFARLTVTDNAGASSIATAAVTIANGPPSGQFVAATNFGGTSSDYGRAVAVDRSGNAFVAGSVASRPFIAKCSPAGTALWTLTFGGAGSGSILGVAAGSDGSVYVTGNLYGTLDFGGGPVTSVGGYDIFVAKFSSAGVHLWSRRFGTSVTDGIASETGLGIAVDTNNNFVAVTGIFGDTVDFGGGPLTSTSGQDLFLLKLSASGSHLWSKRAGGSGATSGSAVAIDGNGNVFLTGRFGQTVDFGGGPVTSTGTFDMFLAKYAPGGALLWASHYGNRTTFASVSGSSAIALDRFGNPVLTGTFKFTMSFGGQMLTSAGYEDIFVAKYSGTNGAHVWSKRFGDWNTDSANGIATDGGGNVTVSGWAVTPLDFGGGPLPPATGVTVYVANLASDGSYRWSKGIAVGSGDGGPLASDALGHSYVTGRFSPSVNFGTGPIGSAGGTDIFLAQFVP